ncbi:MAG TPA: SDR family oxidoreductase [Stellaceae bacterium]|nr:SDR family oxidoreductase [Stellaceae bacterium]
MKLARRTVAVVTGAGSGIGRALALALAERGCALALADKDGRGLVGTADDARKGGAHVVSEHVVDVADLEAMTRFRDEALKAHGRVELLVNNAGVALQGELEELTLENMRWLIDVNFWGVVHGTRLFLPSLRQQRQAHIVNISSIFGIVGVAGQTAYAASKFAVRGFSEVLRHELGNTAIRVSTVHPGGVRTNIVRNARMPTKLDPERRRHLIARFDEMARTTPEQAARRILRGIERDELRILIGRDAQLLATLQWLLPVRYWMLIDRLFLPKEVQKTGKTRGAPIPRSSRRSP